MKSLICSLVLISGVAQAETVDLYTALGFGALHQYHDVDTSLCTTVPCDPAVQVTIYISTLASVNVPPPKSIQLWFGSDLAGAFTGPYYGSALPTVLVSAATGSQITVTLNETSRRVCTRSGRGQTCHEVWTLFSGVLLR